MELNLSEEAEKLIQKHLATGLFDSPEAVVEFAVMTFVGKNERSQFDVDNWAAISKDGADHDHREGVDLRTFRTEITKHDSASDQRQQTL